MSSIAVRQVICFVLTWISYASTYLLRKPLGVVKSDLAYTYKLSKTDLGWLDTALLLPYAVMQILLGSCGDKFGARRALATCLICSSLSMCTFGMWKSVLMFAFLLFLNGTSQATAWPNCVKSLGAWFNDQQRTTIYGLFGTCSFAGGILGSALAVHLQATFSGDIRMVFIIPSTVLFGVGILVFLFLRTPAEVGLVVPGKETPKDSPSSNQTEQKSMTYLQLWGIRMVPELSWTNFSIKLVRYCMYMWLPMYLYQELGYTKYQAGLLATAFEVGGVVGSVILGYLVNKFLSGKIVHGVAVAVMGSAIFLALFQFTSKLGLMCNIIFMLLAGACNCGPDPYLSGSIAAELGDKENAQAAVSGMINGFGSLGTVLEGPIIGLIAETYGWNGTFYIMIAMSVFGTFTMFRAASIDSEMKRAQFMKSVATDA